MPCHLPQHPTPTTLTPSVIMTTLQHIITASTASHHPLPIQSRARWFRILHQLSVNPSTPSDTSAATKTNTLLEQILALLRSSPPADGRDDNYPCEEIEYLATVTYNRAIDAYCAGHEQEFRRLGGFAEEFAGFMDDGGALGGIIKGKIEELMDGAGSGGEEGGGGEEDDDEIVDEEGGIDEDHAGIAGLGGEAEEDVL